MPPPLLLWVEGLVTAGGGLRDRDRYRDLGAGRLSGDGDFFRTVKRSIFNDKDPDGIIERGKTKSRGYYQITAT